MTWWTVPVPGELWDGCEREVIKRSSEEVICRASEGHQGSPAGHQEAVTRSLQIYKATTGWRRTTQTDVMMMISKSYIFFSLLFWSHHSPLRWLKRTTNKNTKSTCANKRSLCVLVYFYFCFVLYLTFKQHTGCSNVPLQFSCSRHLCYVLPFYCTCRAASETLDHIPSREVKDKVTCPVKWIEFSAAETEMWDGCEAERWVTSPHMMLQLSETVM